MVHKGVRGSTSRKFRLNSASRFQESCAPIIASSARVRQANLVLDASYSWNRLVRCSVRKFHPHHISSMHVRCDHYQHHCLDGNHDEHHHKCRIRSSSFVFDAIIIIIIIHVRWDHNHSDTMRSSSFAYNVIIIMMTIIIIHVQSDLHHLCTMRSSSS